jgi:rhodanese-related sulfurtransferase
VHLPLAGAARRATEIRRLAGGRTVVAYCSCPAEHLAAAVALELSRRGVSRVAVLAGGYVEWVRAGGSLSHDAP